VINACYDSANSVDLRGDGIYLGVVDITNMNSVPGHNYVILPDQFHLHVIEKLSHYVNQDLTPTIAPMGSQIILSRNYSESFPTTISMTVGTLPADGTISNLSMALITIPGENMIKALVYTDNMGADHSIHLNDFTNLQQPIVLDVIEKGSLTATDSYIFKTLIMDGLLILQFPNQRLGIKQLTIYHDNPSLRQMHLQNQEESLNNILTTPSNSVPLHNARRRIHNGYQNPDLIGLPLKSFLHYTTTAADALEMGTNWIDTMVDPNFKYEYFYPTTNINYTDIMNPISSSGANKRDMVPTCFFNPLIRTNMNFYYQVEDLLNETIITTYT
jgi:hypothetical protein